ncbi:hypothetical protein CAXC1_180024 [Candidatus Xenohaliotis californiensis]|uniref:Prepilin-type N-terminal cleavage/methylation domain-containing protein n=1 Tax=Candidatus Xenohaliotis californiensis TaxID=84677 RepID=A0ABM9N7E8_9RICK|nr:hypothetical protein CAXC1_180024 [Candidatus Xenohaliotis californiensis]
MTATTIKTEHGISIVESMVVISIIALLSVAILVSRNLIAVAEAQKIINELTTFEEGVFAFYMQYQYLPGDFPDTKLWGDEHIKSICNKVTLDFKLIKDGMDAAYIAGDGDGIVATAWKGEKDPYPTESDMASCHLALSGYLPLNKLGCGVPNYSEGNPSLLSGNLDKDLPFIPGYWINNKNLLHIHSQISNRITKATDLHMAPKGNSIMLTGKYKDSYLTTGIPIATYISSYVLSFLDKKIDDGKPGTGRITFGNVYSNSGRGTGSSLPTLICTALNPLGVAENLCTPDSEFTNISYSNKDSGYMIYQPKWLHDLTEN